MLARCRTAVAHRVAVDAAAALAVPLPVRPARRHGAADLGGTRTCSSRSRSRAGGVDGPRRQARPDAAGAAPSTCEVLANYLQTARGLPRRCARLDLPVRLQPRHAAGPGRVHRAFYDVSRQAGLRASEPARARGCTISVTAWPSCRSLGGTRRATSRSGDCRCYRPTSATSACRHLLVPQRAPSLMAQAMSRLERRWEKTS